MLYHICFRPANCGFSIGCRSTFKRFKARAEKWYYLLALLLRDIIPSFVYFFGLDKHSFIICKRNSFFVKDSFCYISFLWDNQYHQRLFLWKTSCQSTVCHTDYRTNFQSGICCCHLLLLSQTNIL